MEKKELILVLDFDGVVNNEYRDLLKAFDATIKKFSLGVKPYELLAKYILYDEVYGNLDWKEIIKLLFENDEASKYFMQVLEYTPRLELFEFLDRYYGKIKVIIVSRGSKEEIEQFLKKWKLDRYIDQIYGKAKKWSEVFWKNSTCQKEV